MVRQFLSILMILAVSSGGFCCRLIPAVAFADSSEMPERTPDSATTAPEAPEIDLAERLQQAERQGDLDLQARLHHRIAIGSDDRRSVFQHLLSALDLWRKLGDSKGVASALTDLGELSRSDQDFIESMRYLNEAETILKSIDDETGLAQTWNRQAAVLYEMSMLKADMIDQAIEKAEQSLEIARKHQLDHLSFNNLNIIGAALSQKGLHEDAMQSLREALEIIERHEWIEVKPNILNNIARIHVAREEWSAAIAIASESLALAQHTGVQPFIIEAAEILRKSHSEMGNCPEALASLELLAATRNEYYYIERENLVQDLHLKYQTARRDQELVLERNRRKIQTFGLSIVIIFMLLIAMLIIAVILKRKNKEISLKNRTISEQLKNLKIADAEKDHYFYRFNLVAASVNMGIWEVDLHTSRFTWDSRMYRLFGASDKDEQDPEKLIRDKTLPADLHKLTEMTELAVRNDGMLSETFRITTDSGDIRWLELHAVTIKGSSGKPEKLIGAMRDITRTKERERENLERNTRVHTDQKVESLGVMAGGIAHDFNNLLTVISGNLEILKHECGPQSPGSGNLEAAIEATLRAENLTRKMLDYSGKTRSLTDAADLSQVVRNHYSEITTLLTGQASLSINLHDGLPVIRADAEQLLQIIIELVTNAVEAIRGPGGEIHITTGCDEFDIDQLEASRTPVKSPGGLFVWLSIADNGCGMDSDTNRKLFDPFFSTKFHGRGLGMAAVLGIVRGHGGVIFVDSHLGEGTTITVMFPALSNN